MASKTQYTYTVKVVTLGGNEFTATDSATSKAGYGAYQQFLRKDIVEIPGEGKTTYVPYHAINYVEVSKTSSSATYEDNTCVTE